jgi:hypothetical protein
MSQREIAAEVGVHQSNVSRMIARALRERKVENADTLRKVDAARMEGLHNLAWKYAQAGDMSAAGVLVRLLDRRAKLFGLDAQGPNGGSAHMSYTVIATLYANNVREQAQADARREVDILLDWSQKSRLPNTLVYAAESEIAPGVDPADALEGIIAQVIPARQDDQLSMMTYIMHTPAYHATPSGPVVVEQAEMEGE